MKKILILVIASTAVVLSCKKDNAKSGMVNGTLLAADMAMCACCGGNFIVIGDSVFGSATTYRINSVPASSGIDLQNGPFPMDVTLTYSIDSSRCTGWYIKSDDIRRR
ncbi:MAG: hypothetical protein IPP72_03600 [Chitinophagaceae bacterium]|nr:hypothetical protein [Chitinophagaceae bacterium]